MSKISEEYLRDILRKIGDPYLKSDVITQNLVSHLSITPSENGLKITCILDVPSADAEKLEPLRAQIENIFRKLPEIDSVAVIMTAPKPMPRKQPVQKFSFPNIKQIIAVGSGKGGVGKSTVAVSLACALKDLQLRVGLLDADIYGPSLPLLMNIKERPLSPDKKTLPPIEKYGIKCMSMGLIGPESQPTIWRGPMISKALLQFLQNVSWGDLDVLVIDLPPGTGDIQITLAQQIPLSGAIIVTTPQDLSLLDARKGLYMFQQLDVPILGIVENMSHFECPNCGHETHIFSNGGAEKEAKKLKVPLLSQIPLHLDVRKSGDLGVPLPQMEPENALSKVFRKLANKISDQLPNLKKLA